MVQQINAVACDSYYSTYFVSITFHSHLKGLSEASLISTCTLGYSHDIPALPFPRKVQIKFATSVWCPLEHLHRLPILFLSGEDQNTHSSKLLTRLKNLLAQQITPPTTYFCWPNK
jgi:hypothetical protein